MSKAKGGGGPRIPGLPSGIPGLPDNMSPKMMQNAQEMWKMLDEMSKNDPAQYEAFLKKQVAEAGMAEGGGGAPQRSAVQDTPSEAFCVKMRLEGGGSLFANVCHHPRIKSPSAAADGTVPLAVGVPRAAEHRGATCEVVDVVVNAEVTSRAVRDAGYREEVGALAAQCVREVLLSRRFLTRLILPGGRVVPTSEARYVDGPPRPFVDAQAPPSSGEQGGGSGVGADLPDSLLAQLAGIGGGGIGGGRGGGGGSGESGSPFERDGLALPGAAPAAKAGGPAGGGEGRPLVEVMGGAEVAGPEPSEEAREAAAAAKLAKRKEVEARVAAARKQQQAPTPAPAPAPAAPPTSKAAANAPLDVSDDSSASAATSAGGGSGQTPRYELETVPSPEAGETGMLVLRVSLPELSSAAEVDLQVGERAVELAVPGRYQLQLALPCAVASDDAGCRFDKKRRMLTVKMPLAGPQ